MDEAGPSSYGCEFCRERFETQNELGEHIFRCHVKTISCPFCAKGFNSHDHLLRHIHSTHPPPPQNSQDSQVPQDPLHSTHPPALPPQNSQDPLPSSKLTCTECNETFSNNFSLRRHIKNRRCKAKYGKGKKRKQHAPNPPPKRFRWDAEEDSEECQMYSQEEWENDPSLEQVYKDNWSAIRSHSRQGPHQLTINVRWDNFECPNWRSQLMSIFHQQSHRFKINYSHSFILNNNETGDYRFFHSSQNNARALDFPVLINNQSDFEDFISNELEQNDVIEFASNHRDDSTWTFFCVTSTTFYINPLVNFPIGCCDEPIPKQLIDNRYISVLSRNRHSGNPYTDNLCFFRCLALHQGGDESKLEKPTKVLARRWIKRDITLFEGVVLNDLDKLETEFGVSIDVFEYEEGTGFFTPRYRSKNFNDPNKLRLLMFHNHFCYIKNFDKATHSFVCSKCGWVTNVDKTLQRHESVCNGKQIKNIYPGGVFQLSRSPLEILRDNGIDVEENYTFPYYATYDFEAMMIKLKPGEKKDSDKTRFISKHIPMSVSVSSNIPSFKDAICFVSDDENNPRVLVDKMLSYLSRLSDHSFSLLKEEFSEVYAQIERLSDDDRTLEYSPHRLKQVLDGYLHELPIVGFNSSVYDLNLVKTAFFESLVASHTCERSDQDDTINDGESEEIESPIKFIIKNNNEYKCVATERFKFLDVKHYIAPGFSYAKYLTAFESSQPKGFFPYEHIISLQQLQETQLPPKDAFYSSLKGCGISDEEYAFCQRIWVENDMKTLKDFLVWYNNLDVNPFLEALSKQAKFFKTLGLDMLKDGVGIPGLTLKYLFKTLPKGVYFSLINDKHSDLHTLLRNQMVGGPSIIFHRYHEKGKTNIRGGGKTVESLIGFDANALYLWALSQPMPIGQPIRRRGEKNFYPEKVDKFGQLAREWLEWVSHSENVYIRHKYNGKERVLGPKYRPVDGWCAQTLTAYQFHGCVFHGHSCHLTKGHTHHPYNKDVTLTELKQKTDETTAYLRDTVGVNVVEMWECEWLALKRGDPNLKDFLRMNFPRFTSQLFGSVTVSSILNCVRLGSFFGLVQCDIEVPNHLRDYFSELQPIFKNTQVSRDDIGEFMRQYAEKHKLLSQPRRTLVGSYWAKGILLISPLLDWYLKHGLVVTQIQQVVEFPRESCFVDFADKVTNARRGGDTHPDKKILADSFKLLGNSAYGKTLTNLAKHNTVTFVHPSKVPNLITQPLFKKTTPLTDAIQEVEMSKKTVRWNLPNHIGFFVYQYAKLRMLEFHYDCIDRYLSRDDYQLCEMDTDSLYLALSASDISHLIKPGLEKEFLENFHKWFPSKVCSNHKEDYLRKKLEDMTSAPPTFPCCLAQTKHDNRTPGLFKEEYRGDGIVALCSKTYYCFGEGGDKYSCKGLNKRNNNLMKDTFLKVLTSKESGGGVNKGFRTDGRQMFTYEQTRASLSFFYPKRRVQDDGVSTLPTLV